MTSKEILRYDFLILTTSFRLTISSLSTLAYHLDHPGCFFSDIRIKCPSLKDLAMVLHGGAGFVSSIFACPISSITTCFNLFQSWPWIVMFSPVDPAKIGCPSFFYSAMRSIEYKQTALFSPPWCFRSFCLSPLTLNFPI